MTERVPPRCSADAWHECLVAMNKDKDEVLVSTAALEDVVLCHKRKGGQVSHDLIVRDGRHSCAVRRRKLWDLVQEHGRVCEGNGQ